jgi:hypothetical protein
VSCFGILSDESAGKTEAGVGSVSMLTLKTLWGSNHPNPSKKSEAIRLKIERFIRVSFL